MAIILVATVPLTGFVLVLLHGQAEDARQERQASLYRTMHSLSLAFESELAASADALTLMSHDAALQRGDLVTFKAHLQRWPLARPSWRANLVAEAGGKVLFATQGAAAGGLAGLLPQVLEVPEGQLPRVALLPRASPPVTAVVMPVQTVGGRYLLAALIDASQWQRLIDRASVPQDGFVSLVDAGTHVIATSGQQQRLVGRRMPIELQTGLQDNTRSQMPLLTEQPVGNTGWRVCAGMAGTRPLWTEVPMLWSALAAGLLSLLLGLVLALYVARRVSGPLRQLVKRPVGEAAEEPIVVREIAALRRALQASTQEREQAMRALQAKADEFQVLLQERLALVQREQDARHAAEQANRGKDEFIAMLGHELRNPLSAIAAAVEVINRVEPQHPSAQSARRIIGRQTQQLVGLMNELNDMARASAGKIKLFCQRLALAPLVWRTHAALRMAGRFQHHTVTLQLEPVWAEADAMRIEQVVSNLLTNAAKYTPPGGRIALTLRQAEDGQAELQVEDNGMGIPPTLLPKVFDPFVQGERGAERRQGLGLGLTLVRRLMDLHGGSVQVCSAGAGQGSRFVLRLPAAEAAAGACEMQRPLLVVGPDDDAVLPVLEALLGDGPRRIALAPDSAAAVDCLRHDEAMRRGILVAMPRVDQMDSLRTAVPTWRREGPGLRIVVVAEGALTAGLGAGVDALLPQALTPEALRGPMDEPLAAIANG